MAFIFGIDCYKGRIIRKEPDVLEEQIALIVKVEGYGTM
jgi:hypothetical protein